MADNIGSWNLEDTITICVNTHNIAIGSAADTDSGPSYRVYEDSTDTPLLTGDFSKLDDANTVGLYYAQLEVTAANGFERLKSYNIRIEATVNGVTGVTMKNFQIGANSDLNTIAGQTTISNRSILNLFKIFESMHSGAWSFDSANNLTLKDSSGNTLAVVNVGANSQTVVS